MLNIIKCLNNNRVSNKISKSIKGLTYYHWIDFNQFLNEIVKEVHDLWPFYRPINHRFGKLLLSHKLANQTLDLPWMNSSFCSSAYGLQIIVSNCCSLIEGVFLRVIYCLSLKTLLPIQLPCVISMPPVFIPSNISKIV